VETPIACISAFDTYKNSLDWPFPQRYRAAVTSQWNRVTPRAVAPYWLKPVLEALAKLRGLSKNWDGYGSPSIRPAALDAAHLLIAMLEQIPLPTPQVCPVTGGGISFTWKHNMRELEIEILPGGSAQYLAVATDAAKGEEVSQEAPLSLEQPAYGQILAAWIMGS
jgi:hypothetical protein